MASGSWLTAMAHLLVRIAVVAADWVRGSLPEISGEARMHHIVKCAFVRAHADHRRAGAKKKSNRVSRLTRLVGGVGPGGARADHRCARETE